MPPDLSLRSCPDYSGFFGDVRRAERAHWVFGRLVSGQTAVVHRALCSRAEVLGASRFFANDQVSEAELIEASGERAGEVSQGRRVLAIQDSTELNYQKHRKRLKEDDALLGPVGNNKDIGFFVHPTLVVDRSDGTTLGIADVQVWNRRWDKEDKRQKGSQSRALEEKESYRWIVGGEQAKWRLSEAAHVTLVTDQEGDNYEEFTRLPDARTDVLVRARSNRRLADREQKLHEVLAESELQGRYRFRLGSGSKKRQAREVEMEVRFEQVRLQRPDRLKGSEEPESVELYAVEARESMKTAVAGEPSLIWRLLTTRPIETFEQARELIRDYSWRWKIEELNRTLKKEGLQIEDSQHETGASLRRLAIMSLSVALTVMQLVSARDGEQERPASMAFDPQELECLEQIGPRYEGQTLQQQNPFTPQTLAWAAWIIGRLGGWKGYRRAGPAGPITMKRGLQKFGAMFEAWSLAREPQPGERN